jgi:hypothetical protein
MSRIRISLFLTNISSRIVFVGLSAGIFIFTAYQYTKPIERADAKNKENFVAELCDVNKDGAINSADHLIIAKYWSGDRPSDNGKVYEVDNISLIAGKCY